MKSLPLIGGALMTMGFAILPALADCDADSASQSHDLVTFVGGMIKVDHCSTAAGKAAYTREVALLRTLNQRNQHLISICAASDPNWVYVRDTLRIQTDLFSKVVAKGCGK
jgi:hypothetical protein